MCVQNECHMSQSGVWSINMYEKFIEASLRRKVNRLGALCLKFESPGFYGVPDRIILLPGGRVIFVETKAPGKKERARQEYVHDLLRRYGFEVFNTVDSEAKISAVLERCRGVIADAGDAGDAGTGI